MFLRCYIKKTTMKTLFLILISIAFLSACKKTTASYTADCSGAAKSYANDVAPVISSKCIGCHSAFSNYTGVVAAKTNIKSYIIDGSMPKNGTLSATEKNIVICWIDNGALNN